MGRRRFRKGGSGCQIGESGVASAAIFFMGVRVTVQILPSLRGGKLRQERCTAAAGFFGKRRTLPAGSVAVGRILCRLRGGGLGTRGG